MLTLLLLFVFSSCGKTEQQNTMSNHPYPVEETTGGIDPVKVEPEVEVVELKIKNSSMGLVWKKHYTERLLEFLEDQDFEKLFSAHVMERDLELISCKNYNQLTKLQKKQFIIIFLAAIAEAESDFRTELTTINPSDKTVNVGLMQIDYAVANNHTYGRIGHLDNQSLKNPVTNLQVGAYILTNQLTGKIARSRLFPDRTYYWQVLSEKRRVLKNLKMNLSGLSLCQ